MGNRKEVNTHNGIEKLTGLHSNGFARRMSITQVLLLSGVKAKEAGDVWGLFAPFVLLGDGP